MSKRILLITPVFYGIEKKIKETLENQDFEVTWIENKSIPFDYHGTASKLKFLRRLYFLVYSPQKRFIKAEFKKIGDTRFDYLFSINGFILCPYLFRRLKKVNPLLSSILYLWDSFSMYTWKKELTFFTRVYTFDRSDSEKFKLRYKPNFYVLNEIEMQRAEEYEDIFFVGKFNRFRNDILNRIFAQAEKSGISCLIKLWPAFNIFFHHKLIYWFFKKIRQSNLWINNYVVNYEAVEGIIRNNFLIFSPMIYAESQLHLGSSNVVLDLPFHGQTGFSHRLIEALAKGKKIMTTNSVIKNESFFNPQQIKVIDSANPEVDLDWIKDKCTFPVDSDILKLELSEWLKSVIGLERQNYGDN